MDIGIKGLLRSLATGLALALTLSFLSSCVPHPNPPLVFGANVWPGYETIYLARELNYYDPAKVHLAAYSNASQVIRAFHNRILQAAAVTLDEALLLQQDIPDLRIILVFDSSNGADAMLAQPGITTLQQLKGRRIGVEKTALGAYFLSLALGSANMDAGQVTVVSLSVDEHETAFRAGKVDAVVTFEPVRTRLLRSHARQLFDSSRAPGKIIDVLVTRAEYMRPYRDELSLLVQGWHRAQQTIQKEPDTAIPIMAARERVSAAEFRDLLTGISLTDLTQNRALLANAGAELKSSAASMQDYLVQQGLLQRKADISRLFDESIIARVKP